ISDVKVLKILSCFNRLFKLKLIWSSDSNSAEGNTIKECTNQPLSGFLVSIGATDRCSIQGSIMREVIQAINFTADLVPEKDSTVPNRAFIVACICEMLDILGQDCHQLSGDLMGAVLFGFASSKFGQ